MYYLTKINLIYTINKMYIIVFNLRIHFTIPVFWKYETTNLLKLCV